MKEQLQPLVSQLNIIITNFQSLSKSIAENKSRQEMIAIQPTTASTLLEFLQELYLFGKLTHKAGECFTELLDIKNAFEKLFDTFLAPSNHNHLLIAYHNILFFSSEVKIEKEKEEKLNLISENISDENKKLHNDFVKIFKEIDKLEELFNAIGESFSSNLEYSVENIFIKNKTFADKHIMPKLQANKELYSFFIPWIEAASTKSSGQNPTIDPLVKSLAVFANKVDSTLRLGI